VQAAQSHTQSVKVGSTHVGRSGSRSRRCSEPESPSITVGIAGAPKGHGRKPMTEFGKYADILRTNLDGCAQRDYLEAMADKSACDYLFYSSGATPSAVHYRKRKMYYTVSQPRQAGWIMQHDPFERSAGIDQKSAVSPGVKEVF
jgi:hypothetical protein